MEREKLKQAIFDYVTRCRRVIFSEIEMELERLGYEYEGVWAQAVSRENPKVFYWFGWSEDMVDILDELKREGKIHFEASSVLEYLIAGGKVVTLPVVKTFKIYKTDHWIPVAICSGKEID